MAGRARGLVAKRWFAARPCILAWLSACTPRGFAPGVAAHIGYSYAVSTPAGVGITGEVPDIPPESSRSSLLFSWGMMAYPVEDGDQEFTVVTYWVDAPKDN